MTPAITKPVLLPNSLAQKRTFENPQTLDTAGNFASWLDQAVMTPGAKSRNAALRALTHAAFPDEEEESETDEISKQRILPEEENTSAAPPPSWLPGLPATGFVQPVPIPLTKADGQQDAAACCAVDVVHSGEDDFAGAQSLPSPRQTEDSMPSRAKYIPEDHPSEPARCKLCLEANGGIVTKAIHPDVPLGSDGQPVQTGRGPDAPASTGHPSPQGDLAPDGSLLCESNDLVPGFDQTAHTEVQDASALNGFWGLADSVHAVGLADQVLCAVSSDAANSLVQSGATEPMPSGLMTRDPTLAHDEEGVPRAERLNGKHFQAVEAGASRAEASVTGESDAPAAMASNPRLVVAVSSQASDAAKLTTQEQALNTAVSERGMSAAQHTGTMQASHEMNENASLAEQNLPALLVETEAAAPPGREWKARANSVDCLAGLPAGTAGITLALTDQSMRREPGADAVTSAPETVVFEGVHRAIENAAAGLSRHDAASVSLVLTPDGNTQMALHVKLQQGRLEVLAVLERGDFAGLGAEWSNLQNRLAEQGVRLAPLVSGAEPGNAFSGQPPYSENRNRENMLSREIPIPPMAKTAAHQSRARMVAAAGGSEWWA
jgi:hypothetical protein